MKKLISQAFEARKNAYAPYSGFMVGAALEAKDGTVFKGCNIENSAFSPTNCAERTAIFKAVSEGYREFRRIAIVGGMEGESVAPAPCGVCRQVMLEFCEPDFQVIMAKSEEDFEVMTLEELTPKGFQL